MAIKERDDRELSYGCVLVGMVNNKNGTANPVRLEGFYRSRREKGVHVDTGERDGNSQVVQREEGY